MIANLLALAAFLLAALILLRPTLRESDEWRATVTPLASIVGSGFLVSLPLLANHTGAWALAAMMFLVGASWLLGGTIRFNIVHGEPLFDTDGRYGLVTSLERFSHLALAFAYFVSVTYYLSLLSAFLLKAFAVTGHGEAKVLTTAMLCFIGVYGFARGLRGLETVEEYAVGLKLAVIAAVLAALAWFNLDLFVRGQWAVRAAAPDINWDTARLVLGMLIVVQGFETSRFLKDAYPAELRVATMRRAQLISAAIYALFFALATVLFDGGHARGDIAAVTDIVARAAVVLPLMLIAGAVFSQLSAAVADAIGAAGLIVQFGPGLIDRRHAYPFIAAIGVLLVWETNIFGIIAIASRAFALFYFLQCLVAALVALNAPEVTNRSARVAAFLALAVLALAVVAFGIPAEVE